MRVKSAETQIPFQLLDPAAVIWLQVVPLFSDWYRLPEEAAANLSKALLDAIWYQKIDGEPPSTDQFTPLFVLRQIWPL